MKIIIFSCKEKKIDFIEDTFLVYNSDSEKEGFDTILWVNPKKLLKKITIQPFIKKIGSASFSRCSSLL